ncbi:DHBP synthase RibB-like alpha/beta domain-containing protein [Fomitopsis serialis]|uniref:DHBP synthase RibB-like alpha/beta domain-containing protein n=1 Tax=Fomitopsis serialis TaxID=139415 RepID=UPI00200726D3|nr:DHBP synthase RibB-like alpha/beta domain-containing protein [Neoantrodia serialis]KAH9938313.1 DHBP synthase RibB-like alpha/beta domain-containing protein [Neoantrodia serialis]
MPKHYCDYCDVFLTHDSASVRKAHNSGRNHLANVRDYYASLGHDKAQSIIDQITSAYESSGGPPPGGFGFGPQHLAPPAGYGGPPMGFGGPGFGGPPGARPPFPPPGMMGPPGAPPFPPNGSMPPPGMGPPGMLPPGMGASGAKMAYSTEVLRCDPSSISFDATGTPVISSQATAEALQRAARLVKDKQTVAFPTETVYGLGADALDAEASSRIYAAKGRPPDNPLIAHVSSREMLQRLLPVSYTIPPIYEVLIRHLWPGPLTLLFPTNPDVVPSLITANQPTVAIRMPSHPVARALIALADTAVAAPSANSSGRPSPTRAEHVLKDMNGKIALILDGGSCDVGLESTVVDGLHEDGDLRVLRPGGVTVEGIENALRAEMQDGATIPRVLVHRRDFRDEAMEQAPTTPGMKYRHYSPTVPVVLLKTSAPPSSTQTQSVEAFLDSILKERTSSERPRIGLMVPSDSSLLARMTAFDGVEWVPHLLGRLSEPGVSAQRLFDGLLTLDNAGVDLIVVEGIKEQREGLAFMNRVNKAAGQTVWIDDS